MKDTIPHKVASFEYVEKVDDAFVIMGRIERWEPSLDGKGDKSFLPFVTDENGTFSTRSGKFGKKFPLYHLDEVLEAIRNGRPIFFVEGEGKGDDLRERLKGHAAVTTIPFGAQAPLEEQHLFALRGAKKIIVLPDSSGKGRDAAKERAVKIASNDEAAEVFIVDLFPDLDDDSDIADWLNQGHKLTELRKLVDVAPRIIPTSQSSTAGSNDDTETIVWDEVYPWPELREEALHGVAGRFVRTVEPHSECDTAALLGNFLVSAGAIIGPGPYFLIESTRHTARLFVLIVGASSWARKGTARDRVRYVFSLAIGDVALDTITTGGLSSGEGLLELVADKTDSDGNVTKTEKRLLASESEFNRTLTAGGRESSTLFDILRQAWESGRLRLPVRHRPLNVTGAHICMSADITASELTLNMPTVAMVNGVINRYIMLCARRSKKLAFGGDLKDEDLWPIVTELKNALESAATVERVSMSPAAAKVWKRWYEEFPEGVGLLGEATARGPAHVLRIALIYALLDKSRQIELQHLRAALAVWDYSAASAAYIFGSRHGDPVADKHLKTLRDAYPAGMTGREIDDVLGKLPSGKLESIREMQLKRGLIRYEKEPSEGRGRPTVRWFAIPRKPTDKMGKIGSSGFNPFNPQPIGEDEARDGETQEAPSGRIMAEVEL